MTADGAMCPNKATASACSDGAMCPNKGPASACSDDVVWVAAARRQADALQPRQTHAVLLLPLETNMPRRVVVCMAAVGVICPNTAIAGVGLPRVLIMSSGDSRTETG